MNTHQPLAKEKSRFPAGTELTRAVTSSPTLPTFPAAQPYNQERCSRRTPGPVKEMSEAAFPYFSSSAQCWGLAGAQILPRGEKNQLCNIISEFQTGIKEYSISSRDRGCSGIKVGRI